MFTYVDTERRPEASLFSCSSFCCSCANNDVIDSVSKGNQFNVHLIFLIRCSNGLYYVTKTLLLLCWCFMSLRLMPFRALSVYITSQVEGKAIYECR